MAEMLVAAETPWSDRARELEPTEGQGCDFEAWLGWVKGQEGVAGLLLEPFDMLEQIELYSLFNKAADFAAAAERAKVAGLVAALEEWVAFYDALRASLPPSDPLREGYRKCHGARAERSRAALAAAGAAP